MADLLARFRAASKEDCYELACLFRIASGGVADYMWSRLAPKYPGLTPLEIGARRFAREGRKFSYKNCVAAEQDGAVIGMLFTFPIEEGQEADDEPADPILKPYEELEIPGSFYICALALLPGFRGRGVGTKMLSIAREQAHQRGFGTLSLLVFEQNEGAVRLYERNGFKVAGRAPVVPHKLIQHTGDVLLMASKICGKGPVREQGRLRGACHRPPHHRTFPMNFESFLISSRERSERTSHLGSVLTCKLETANARF